MIRTKRQLNEMRTRWFIFGMVVAGAVIAILEVAWGKGLV